MRLKALPTKQSLFTLVLLCALSMPAQAEKGGERTRSLTNSNVQDFLEKMREIGTGLNETMEQDDIRAYLERHIAEKAHYESAITFDIPGMPRQETQASLSKVQYIDTLLNDLPTMQAYKTEVSIDDIDIDRSGRVANLKTVITETGSIPWGEEDDGTPRLIPVKGTSKCDQKIVISLSNYMQMAKATCKTLIKFDPFAGKELGEP